MNLDLDWIWIGMDLDWIWIWIGFALGLDWIWMDPGPKMMKNIMIFNFSEIDPKSTQE